MTYACEDCGFLFFRAGEITECPSCEKVRIRSATEKETQKLQTLLEQGKTCSQSEEVHPL